MGPSSVVKFLTALLTGLLINAAALWIAVEIVPSAVFDGRFVDLLAVAFVFGLVNVFVRPVARLLTLPLALMTFGVFTFVVNGALLLITAELTDTLEFEGGFFARLGSATLAAIIVSVVSVVIAKVLPDRE